MKPFIGILVYDGPIESHDQTRALVPWKKFQFDGHKHKRMRTICEHIREMWRDAESKGDIVAMQRLEVIHDMAKRMDKKLREYAAEDTVRTIKNGK